MWDWLLWGAAPKPRPKQLGDVIDRLLGAGPQLNGDDAFELPEKELKRLCSAARCGRRACRPGAGAACTRVPAHPCRQSDACGASLAPPLPPLAAEGWPPHTALMPLAGTRHTCRDLLLKEPTLLEISTGANVVVVGDL